ncbi:MAG: DUF4058 family protein [Planctomycetales bacterium]
MTLSFPGMNPFIESQAWEDFHLHFIAELANAIVPQVRPRYVVRTERRIYVEHDADETDTAMRADLAVIAEEARAPLSGDDGSGGALTVAPVMLTLPLPRERREAFLTIRERESLEIVTVLELLSPSNKRRGGDGRVEYLRKREAVLQSQSHLVELDLLRGGERLPTVEPLPSADYYALVTRANRRPQVAVYPWNLRNPMPIIPVPLSESDGDVTLNLQEVFSNVHHRVGYDYSLDYRAALTPPLSEAQEQWLQALGD